MVGTLLCLTAGFCRDVLEHTHTQLFTLSVTVVSRGRIEYFDRDYIPQKVQNVYYLTLYSTNLPLSFLKDLEKEESLKSMRSHRIWKEHGLSKQTGLKPNSAYCFTVPP